MNRRALIAALPAAMVAVAMPAVIKMASIVPAPGSAAGDNGFATYLRFLASATPDMLREFAADLEAYGTPGLDDIAAKARDLAAQRERGRVTHETA